MESTSKRHAYRAALAAAAALCGLAAAAAAAAPVAAAADHYQAPGNFNPLVPGYFADPTVKQFGDTFYMYATTDGTNVGLAPASVWTSKDFVHWTYHTLNWPTSHHVWAPEVVHNARDGNYYYYYSQPCRIFGGVAQTPLGPFRPLRGEDGLVVENYLVEGIMTLDGQILKDDDGSMVMFWGTWGVFANHGVGIGKLQPDMASFSELRAVRSTDVKEFFEAPEPVKRDGVYYLTYSSGSCHDRTYRVQYAVSTEGVYGPYVYGPNNPILETNDDETVHGPGHHCVLKVGDAYFIVYHRHDLPHSAGGMFRQVAADVLRFGPGNTIEKVTPTHAGVGYLGANTNPFPNLARGAKATASSTQRADVRPAFAVDDNHATQWRPATTVLPAWLHLDLGSVQSIARTRTSFEYAHWYYQYLIEYSLDGGAWRVFADKRNNTCYGSPMTDYGAADARFLRLTITGVERQGMMPAIWNFQVFGAAKEDPPQQLVHLEAGDLDAGKAPARWTNHRGMIGGAFLASGQAAAGELDGRRAVLFEGRGMFTSSFRTPESENAVTVMGWVHPRAGEGLVTAAGEWGVPAALFETGRWQFFGLVMKDGGAALYIDHTRTTAGGVRGRQPAPGAAWRLGEGFTGGLAQLRVFNRELHPAEMAYYREKRPRTPGGPAEPTHGLVAHLDAMDQAMGSAPAQWRNLAPFGGVFTHHGRTRVGVAGGRQAMLFDGQSRLQSSFNAPRSLSGNGAYTVAVWAFNPRIDEEEVLVAWSRRGGPDSSAAAFGFGSHGRWGAMAHWGWSDTAWGAHLPPAGQWTHLAATFDGTFVTLYVDGKPVLERRTTLFLHADLPITVGAGPGNHAPFTGAIASVRLYDQVLDAAAIGALASERQAMDIGFHVEASTLPYGAVQDIKNMETLGGVLVAEGAGAEVRNMAGKIAIGLNEGGSLALRLPPGVDPLAKGGATAMAVAYLRAGAAWRMFACTVEDGRERFYVDGEPVRREDMPLAISPARPMVLDARRGVDAVASLMVIDRAFSAEELQAWRIQLDGKGPGPDPMVFAVAPVAVTPEAVFMTAAAAAEDAGVVEYYFRELTGNVGGKDSGWLSENRYMNTGLQPGASYAYSVFIRDAHGNVTRPSEAVAVVTDPNGFDIIADRFDTGRDVLAQGTGGTIWHGFKGRGEGEAVTSLVARDGVLRMASEGTDWAFGTPRGPFLFRNGEGDFVAQVEVADALGLRQRSGYGNNETGLMVRVADADLPGREERHVSLAVFPAWGCGNLWTDRRGGHRAQESNRTHVHADRHLQIQKLGNLFFIRTSADGKAWKDMKGSPLVRDDMKDATLQVGLYHATYGNLAGYGEFAEFRLIRPVRPVSSPQAGG